MTDTCERCRFYRDAGVGTCHKHAPLPSSKMPQYTPWWPIVGCNNWCGEFEAREQKVRVPNDCEQNEE